LPCCQVAVNQVDGQEQRLRHQLQCRRAKWYMLGGEQSVETHSSTLHACCTSHDTNRCLNAGHHVCQA
jgi:hypothetical protein